MMRRTLRHTALALTVGVLLAPACSRDPDPGTPAAAAEGERLMRQMSDTLVSASKFKFATVESLKHPDQSTGRVLHFTRTVTVRRPDAMFFEVAGTGDTAIDVSAYYDGRTVSLRNNAHGMWAETTRARHARRDAGRRRQAIFTARAHRRRHLQSALRGLYRP